MTCRKLPILNVYARQIEAKEAFTKALAELSFTKFSYRNLVVETEDSMIQFCSHTKLEDVRQNIMGKEYWRIYFHCDLEPEVHQFYLSRIRFLLNTKE